MWGTRCRTHAGVGESKEADPTSSARAARLSQASPLDIDRAFLSSRHYTVSELLGQGGFGQVAKAVNTTTSQEYVCFFQLRDRLAGTRCPWRSLLALPCPALPDPRAPTSPTLPPTPDHFLCRVAIKVISKLNFSSEKDSATMKLETALMTKVKGHPNVVCVRATDSCALALPPPHPRPHGPTLRVGTVECVCHGA
jgi:hypothetical protein